MPHTKSIAENRSFLAKTLARVNALGLAMLCLALPMHHAFAQEESANHASGPAIDAAIAGDRFPADRVQDGWRKPREILNFLEVAPGHHVLDFYSGPGYYSELLSRVVGPAGSVLIYNNELYAQAAHHDLMKRLGRNRLPNAKLLKESSNYLKLPPASLDRVLFVQVYHDLYWQPAGSPEPMGDPKKVLAILHAALKPGGMVVVIDHVANDTPRENLTAIANRMHRIDPKAVRADFEQAGFAFAGESELQKNAEDDHSKSVFNTAIRHRTDQFIYKFRRP